jgi:hypothetical protein
MRYSFLLLLAILGSASSPKPPAARVTLSPITIAAYEQAHRRVGVPSKLLLGEAPVFTVRKQKGRLIIPTEAGNKLFKDKVFPENEVDDVTYEYLGFFPKHQVHLIRIAYYESSEILLVEKNGNIVRLVSEPLYSPSQQRLLTASRGIVYAMMPNSLQLAERVGGRLQVVWEMTPKNWEPVDLFWTSDSVACLKQELINSTTEAPFEPARFTYARLRVRPAIRH